MPKTDRNRSALQRAAEPSLAGGERIVAMLPFTHVPKRPKGSSGKVKVGIYQSYRRYRPLVLTDRRLLIFETGRTPFPRALLAEFATGDVDVADVSDASFGTKLVVLELPGEGRVPFNAGKKDQTDLDLLIAALGTVAPDD